jgi:hypothetical protein
MSSYQFHKLQAKMIACLLTCVCGSAWSGDISSITNATIDEGLPSGASKHSISFDYVNLEVVIAGVAGGTE